MTHVVLYNERIEVLEERCEGCAEGCGEGGDEVPSRSNQHRVVFRSFFGRFLAFILIRILLADGLLFEDGGGQRADLFRLWNIVSFRTLNGRNRDSLVSINAGPTLFKVSARAMQSPEATFLSSLYQHRVRRKGRLCKDQNFQYDIGCSPLHDGIEVS